MDIRCPKCAEPWDMDTLHDEVAARFPGAGNLTQEQYTRKYDEVYADFRKRGCGAIDSYNARCNPETLGSNQAQVTAALADLLGDDVDGLASMLDDVEHLGMFE